MKNIEVEDALERYADMIYRIALIHCAGVREDAEDVFQEVFLILLRRRMGFREEEHRKAWLIRVTLNQCKKKHHGRQRMIPMDHEILYAKLEEDQKEERKEQGDLYERLCCLPERYRRVIELYYIEEISTEVIAQYLKLSKSAVRKRLQRGREMLREKGANVDE